jgi:hypothetical protein
MVEKIYIKIIFADNFFNTAIQEDTALKRETQISSFERKNSNLEKVEPHEICYFHLLIII